MTIRRGDARFAITQPVAPASITSAALSTIGDGKVERRSVDARQSEAYDFNEIIGEVGYLNTLTADTVGRCNVRIMQDVPGDGSEDPVVSEDPRPHRVMRAFVGPTGDIHSLMAQGALCLKIAGEGYLVGTTIPSLDGRFMGIVWEMLSVEEIKPEGKERVKRNSGGSGSATTLPEDTYIARMWQPDPRYSDRPDSALMRNAAICREIITLTQVVDAVAKSRLSAGALFVPDELSFGPIDPVEDPAGESDDVDEFTEELIDHMSAPVEDRTSAAGLVPLVIRGAADLGESIRLIDLARDLDTLYLEIRQEALTRLARGLDAPPEIIEGKGGLNHWTGYNVDADFIAKHVGPAGQKVLDFYTVAYLRPMLVEFEGMTQEEAAAYSLQLDTSPITSRSDDAETARVAYDRIELSGDALRRHSGFTEAEAPSEEERLRRILTDVLERRPLEFASTILPILFPEQPVDLPGSPGTRDEVPSMPLETPADPAVDQDSGQGEPAPASIGTPLVDRLATAADAALERALERAGNRVISNMARLNGAGEEVRARVREADKTEVMAVVGPANLERMGHTPATLSSGAWARLRDTGKRWVRDSLTAQGTDYRVADERAEDAMRRLCEAMDERFVQAALAPCRVGGNGLRVPDDMVREALAAAGALR